MLYLLRTQAHLLRDNVLEGVPTQDMLVSLEREPETLDESELITSFTTASTRFHIRNLQQLAWRLLSLDERLLSSLIWTVIVVVKSDSPLACKMVLFALAHLLPIGCVRISASSSAYTDQYKHNLLGLTSVEAEVPADKLENTFVLRVQEVDAAGAPDSLDSFNFLVENNPAHGGPRPKLLRRYLQLLSDRSLSVAVVQAAIKAARSEWLNRAKEVFQLSRQHERIDLDGVLRIFRCGVEDSPVILFFQAGLSRVYRQVVLNTILSSGKPPSTSSSAQRPR
ncbi:Folliculin-C domain-containing protein [Aphelenchoides fujianensis]|nr:Folliculin-C domain-containing protein [Aphelenchoides fujianensis]